MNKLLWEVNSKLRGSVLQSSQVLDLTVSENQAIRAQLEDALQKLKEAPADNKNLIERSMLKKMMQKKFRMHLRGLSRLIYFGEVDSLVRQREEGYEDFLAESVVPFSRFT
ncbi:hypothetical protein KSP40_PGU000250 [Platanthera guangdongensis]|uniref:Uncharacterized protein n=1 Tax=Platanthera guangdongensis TaxID=2320717 RepID=A0ABR2LUS4_9ASPA